MSLLLLCAATSAIHHGHVVDHAARVKPLILTALSSATVNEIPSAFDWRNVDGRSMVTADVSSRGAT